MRIGDMKMLQHSLRGRPLETRGGGNSPQKIRAKKNAWMSLVPEGYEPYPFRNGVPECLEDMLKSIVATYRLCKQTAKCKYS
jgi:hypothetical protein